MNQLNPRSMVVGSKTRNVRRFFIAATNSFQCLWNISTTRRKKKDQTTRCIIISNAGMLCSTFQYMGLKPQIKNAVDAQVTPVKDSCWDVNLLYGSIIFRQDSQDNQDVFLPFCSLSLRTEETTERQKASYLFEVRRPLHLLPTNNNAKEKASIVYSSVLFSAVAEFRFLGFIWKPRKNQVNPVDPVGKCFRFMCR